MADCPDEQHEDHEETPGYKPPAEKKLEDIVNQDVEDESLQKYKEALLGEGAVGAVPCTNRDMLFS